MISELSATYQFGGGYECGITSLAQNDRPTTVLAPEALLKVVRCSRRND